MKRILFPILLVVTLLAGAVVAFSIWRASPQSAQDFLQSGKKYLEEGKYSEATIQLMNAVQKDARNRDALFLLAQSYLKQGNGNAAAKQLQALLEYFPNDVEANLQLGNLYLGSGGTDPKLFQEVSTIAAKVLALEPQNVRALILSGNAAAGLRDYETSVETFEKALSLDPQNSGAFVSLGTTQAVQKNFAEAEKAFLKAREIDPKNRTALVSLGNFYRAMNEPKKAEDVFKDALTQYPADPAVYGQLVQLYYQSGRIDDAVSLLRDVQTKNAKDPRPSFVLSELYSSRNQPAEARTVLLDLKKTFPENLDVAARLATNLMRDKPEQARAEIDQILKAQPKSPVGTLLLGELQYFGGQYDAAETTLSDPMMVNTRFPEVQFFLGDIATRKGKIDQAQDHYQKALGLNPAYLPARVALGGLLLDQGKPADARVEIRKVLDMNKNYPPARMVMAGIDRVEKRYAEAEAELMSLEKEMPASPELQQQLGLYYASRGRTADAEKSFIRALELQPDAATRLMDLVQFYVQSRQPEKAIQRINAIPEDKKQLSHYIVLGTIYSQTGKLQEAEATYKKAIEKDPKNSSGDAALAGLYLQSGRTDDAIKKLDDVIRKDPSNAGAYANRGMIYQNQGKIPEAKQNYQAALQADPGADLAANNLAYILAEEGRDLQTALTWAQSARKRQPSNAGIADTLGWVYYKLGNHVMAREQLQYSISKEPANPVFQYHLGMIYTGLKQPKEAQDALRKAVSSPQDFKEKALAQAALNQIGK